MKPNIFILGPSGSGKSSCLRNLDPTRTGILNSEQKALPFRGAGKFKGNVPITGLELDEKSNLLMPSMADYWENFNKAIASPKCDILVNESFTSLTELVYNAMARFFSGFDLWREYNNEIGKILHRAKNTNKYVVFTGIDMVLEGENGIEERAIMVQGNKWKKAVEKEFVIVLYTTVRLDENGNPEHVFITNKMKGHLNIPAKSPEGMLPPVMPNDLALVIDYIEKYYNGDETEVVIEPPHEHKAVEGSAE